METQNKIKILYVNPVPRASVQGWNNISYVVYKKGTNEVISSSRVGATKAVSKQGSPHETFMFPIDYTSMKVITGLDETIDNPLYGLTVKDIRNSYRVTSVSWPDEVLEELTKNEYISAQVWFEIKHNVKQDFYSDMVNGGTIFETKDLKLIKENVSLQPTFLQRFKFTFYDRPNRITDETPRGELAQQLIRVHPSIANSKTEINSAIHRWYISEENEAELERIKKQDIIHKAIANLVTLKEKHSDAVQYKVAALVKTHTDKALVAGEVSKSSVVDRLNTYVSVNDKHQLDNINKFTEIFNLLGTKPGKKKLDMMFLLSEAIRLNIMSLSDGWFVWHSKSDIPNLYKITTDYKKLINFFLKEKEKFNPEDKESSNWYGDLLYEVSLKGGKTDLI